MTPEGTLVVDTEFKGRSIQVYRVGPLCLDSYWCYSDGKLVQEDKPAEAVMGWLANMMMNA